MRRASAFTLVELLVVIGIIALLVAILLPALNRARNQAQTLACAANLRSIGQAISIYVNNNKGMLPYGYWNGETASLSVAIASIGKPADIQTQSDWSMLLMMNAFGKGDGTYATESLIPAPMFQCPSADFSNLPMNPLYPLTQHRLSYGCNPRLMPNIGMDDPANPLVTLKPYRITHIQRSAEVCLIWDAQQVYSAAYPYMYGNCFPVSDQVDDYGLFITGQQTNYSETCNYLLMGNGVNGSSGIWTSLQPWLPYYAGVGLNGTGGHRAGTRGPASPASFSSEIQWRHGVNEHDAKANFLFVDGHVQTMTLNFGLNNDSTVGVTCEVEDKNIYVNPNY
ncbi:MAG TPA: prepilin-type N-terminal cleavage/methylation domain-containing protein [Tepidisphaeraceae bacterium]|nr:prepilin-type N-terminal cleavage/methylation domain-containing protein [Tepidisphaeraceae bacterium]